MAEVRRRADLGEPAASPIRRYKLNATLSAGGNAAAYWVVWNPTNSDYEAQDGGGSPARPTDSFNLYSGPNNFTGSKGDFGYAAYFPDRGQWEAIGGGGSSTTVKWVSFVTSSALTNQASLSGCAVVLDWYGNTGGITQVDVTNEMGWQADAGVLGYAAYRPADSKWILMLIPCPAGNS